MTLALFRVVALEGLRAATARAAVLYVAIGVGAAIVFGGANGMHASDLTTAMRLSLPLRAALWGAWIVGTAPAADALLVLPTTFYLRSLPVGRARFWLAHGLLLVVAEAPWVLLWARGEGGAAGAAAGLLVLAAHALVVARSGRWLELLLAAALGAAMLWPAPMVASLALGAIAAPVAVAAAFRRAPERGPRRSRRWVGGPATVALALAHLVTVRRSAAAVLARGLIVTLVGGAATALIVRNNAIGSASSVATLSIGIGAVTLTFAAASLAGPVLRSERRDRWLLDVTATGGATRALAAAVAGCAWIGACGLLHAALVATLADLPRAQLPGLLGAGAATGATVAAIAVAASRWAERDDDDPRAADRVTGVLLAWIAAVLVAVVGLGGWALVFMAATAGAATGWSGRVAARRGR